jgi:hypothetical protein
VDDELTAAGTEPMGGRIAWRRLLVAILVNFLLGCMAVPWAAVAWYVLSDTILKDLGWTQGNDVFNDSPAVPTFVASFTLGPIVGGFLLFNMWIYRGWLRGWALLLACLGGALLLATPSVVTAFVPSVALALTNPFQRVG